ncbi:MAG: hypothetical protein HGB22_08035 [Chlorobiaceae bacterium]|nr:hypothetical protein [Chlorobiaceae bacterium]
MGYIAPFLIEIVCSSKSTFAGNSVQKEMKDRNQIFSSSPAFLFKPDLISGPSEQIPHTETRRVRYGITGKECGIPFSYAESPYLFAGRRIPMPFMADIIPRRVRNDIQTTPKHDDSYDI